MKRLLALALLAGCATAPAAEHAAHTAPGKPGAVDRDAKWKASLARAPLAATAAFDARGRLWLVRIDNGHALVSRSEDRGRTFTASVRVNVEPERIAADGENRPKLAFGRNGETYVSWTQSGDQPFSGHVRFARSLDDGRTFGAPLTVNDNLDPISHRFDSLLVAPDGKVHLAWLDKRDSAAAQQRGEKYSGISLYHAVSHDGGATFSANTRLADHSCECCRIALALDSEGVPVALWRHVFGRNVRDHALLRLDGKSALTRASFDDWAVDACPHHGPALAIAADGAYHLAWFSGAPDKAGLYYARSRDRGRSFSKPLRLGDPGAQPGRPQVLAVGDRLFLAWKEFDGRASVVRAMTSRDGGQGWSAPRTLAAAAGASDHPLLIGDGKAAYLSWNALQEGHRLIEIPADLDRP